MIIPHRHRNLARHCLAVLMALTALVTLGPRHVRAQENGMLDQCTESASAETPRLDARTPQDLATATFAMG